MCCTSITLLHLDHPILITCATSSYITPLSPKNESIYLNCLHLGITIPNDISKNIMNKEALEKAARFLNKNDSTTENQPATQNQRDKIQAIKTNPYLQRKAWFGSFKNF